jgi:hypothetical protein
MPISSKNGDFSSLKNKPQKANTLAVMGFLAPFVAAGMTCGLLLISGDSFRASGVFVIYQIVTPLVLITGHRHGNQIYSAH